ncbi:hypothetical protein K3495_g4877 [Podosphaera aphanis]|nr:hypothetical protein K3495_g4877 [Podosphaera aphanis]
MTVILRSWNPLEALIMSSQPGPRRRSKRIAGEPTPKTDLRRAATWLRPNASTAYDEEDGDFIFTRGPKRAKVRHPELEAVAAPVATPPAPVAKRGKKSKETSKDGEHANNSSVKRDIDHKTNHIVPGRDTTAHVAPKKRKTTRAGAETAPGERTSGSGALHHGSRRDTTSSRHAEMPVEPKHSTTLIALPMSDTPVINRNKELRKKGGSSARRSSLGLRGRRASSLIDNGHSAIPHREVETCDFYKHIEAEGLSEPRRMKQLLTWTGERCLGPKPSHGNSQDAAELAARHVKESLLKDFAQKSELSDWFNRELAQTTIVKKPNPRNVELENSLVAVEARLKILRDERDKWKELAKPPPVLPPILAPGSTDITLAQIDATLLDPEQAAILADVSSTSAHALRHDVATRLAALQARLEVHVDQFADGIHKLDQYQVTVGRVADQILALSARSLAARERRAKERVGTRDIPVHEVLRSLSRILPPRD